VSFLLDTCIISELVRPKKTPHLSVIDALIAATAAVHNFILVTRNTSDFNRCSIDIIDPWSTA
jgi:predicted nucleic acid-binding protein